MPYRMPTDERQRWIAQGCSAKDIADEERERGAWLAEEEIERRWLKERELREYLHDTGNWRI